MRKLSCRFRMQSRNARSCSREGPNSNKTASAIDWALSRSVLIVSRRARLRGIAIFRSFETGSLANCATHRNLEEMILEKQFRSDLYYRLNVVPISIPPFRERSQDIPLLVQHFVQQAARRMNKTIDTIPSDTMEALTGYQWPRNIRELENVIERAVILSPGPVLQVPLRDLHTRVTAGHDCERLDRLADVERERILSILWETRWVLSGPRGAAARLGMNRSTLYFCMKELGIVRP